MPKKMMKGKGKHEPMHRMPNGHMMKDSDMPGYKKGKKKK